MSARPGRILADITIDLPRPRELEIKRTPAFIKYADQIWSLISTQLKPHLHDVDGARRRGRRVTVELPGPRPVADAASRRDLTHARPVDPRTSQATG